MDDRNDPGSETTTAAESGNSGASTTRTRIGLDVGTSKVVTARGDSTRSDGGAQLNAFFVVPYSSLHESTLQNNRVPFFREGDELVLPRPCDEERDDADEHRRDAEPEHEGARRDQFEHEEYRGSDEPVPHGERNEKLHHGALPQLFGGV